MDGDRRAWYSRMCGASDRCGSCACLLLAALSLAATAGCVTRNQLFSAADYAVIDGQYAEAIAILEADREEARLYNRALDRVLYQVDLGLLLYFDSQYQRSNDHLAEAERLIDEYYTKSITQAIGSVLLNDRVVEYPGEDFEDLYINLFKALNYIALQEYDSAFVEVRRMNNKIQYFETKHNVARKELAQSEHADALAVSPSDSAPSAPFTASALAHFLSMLLYARDGEWDDASIDFRALTQLFSQTQNVYPADLPALVSPQEWQASGREATRRVVIALAGLSPEKIEESVIVLTGGFSLRIALPVLTKRDSVVARVGLFDSAGQLIEYLGMLESVEEVALQTFERRKGIIYAKSIIRALTKSIAASILTAVLDEANIPILGELLQIAAVVSEQADLRAVRYLPARVYVYDRLSGAPVPVETAPVETAAVAEPTEVRFLSDGGETLCRQPLNTPSPAARLHIETAVCIR